MRLPGCSNCSNSSVCNACNNDSYFLNSSG